MHRKQLFIFPHAGGSDISYSNMEKSLSHCFEIYTISYPGRGRRYAENLATNLNDLIDDCIKQITARTSHTQFYFMGHSFGALMAFECARLLEQKLTPSPSLLFLSGRGSPTHLSLSASKHLLNDYQLTDYLKSIGGLPDELLNSSFLSFYLPIIRNDLALNANYHYQNTNPVNIPLVVINGLADPVVTTDAIADWQLYTTAPCKFKMLEGGHFFHMENPAFIELLCSYSEQTMGYQFNTFNNSLQYGIT